MAGIGRHAYNESETNCLQELILKHELNSAKTLGSITAKKAAWARLTEEYNTIETNSKRTEAQLKKCWENLKTRRKSVRLTQEKREEMRTEGGSVNPNLRSTSNQLHVVEVSLADQTDFKLIEVIYSDDETPTAEMTEVLLDSEVSADTTQVPIAASESRTRVLNQSATETGESEGDAAAGPSLSGVKRKRTQRVTSRQTDALLTSLEARPYLHTRKFTGLRGRENFDAGWKEIASELNQLRNGSIKTPEQWMTVWRDFKSRACSKAARLRKERVQTNNRDDTTAPLTEVERRIVTLVGMGCSFGTECPDAMPEKDMIQCEMETGVSTSEVIRLPQTQHSELEFVEVENSVPVDTVAPSGSWITGPPLPSPTELQIKTAIQSPTPQINLNPCRSVDEQYSSAQRDFLAIAESNAESMRMLAAAAKLQGEAAKTQAEASIMIANAADKIAEAAKIQAETSLVMANTSDKIAEALIKIMKN